jgi:RNA polymerase sigma-70 factor (ECF subfamily)
VLESLSPEQRAAFLLREVFDEPYDRIAEIVGTSEQNARQLATRARRHVHERRPRFEASREQHEELATRFFAAVEQGDLQGLEELLADDVVLRGDGGGKAPALRRAIHGRATVARTLVAGLRALARFGLILRREQINGQPGALVVDREGRPISVMSLDVAEGQIQGVSAIVNPDKLRHLGPLGDLGALLPERGPAADRALGTVGDRHDVEPAADAFAHEVVVVGGAGDQAVVAVGNPGRAGPGAAVPKANLDRGAP